ncbi:hypothetical protein KFU94_58035 [Chloroflexi bacterium TSY]|nr:hypothetical protein [Chloroflexi bacterium TSY]
MNIFLIVLGSFGLIGTLAHITLGERFIIRPLHTDSLPTSFLGDGDITKRYLRWFWHVGSFDIGGSSLALIVIGLLYGAPGTQLLARFIAVHFIAIFGAFLGVAIPRPELFVRVPQGVLLGIGGLLVWLAA